MTTSKFVSYHGLVVAVLAMILWLTWLKVEIPGILSHTQTVTLNGWQIHSAFKALLAVVVLAVCIYPLARGRLRYLIQGTYIIAQCMVIVVCAFIATDSQSIAQQAAVAETGVTSVIAVSMNISVWICIAWALLSGYLGMRWHAWSRDWTVGPSRYERRAHPVPDVAPDSSSGEATSGDLIGMWDAMNDDDDRHDS